MITCYIGHLWDFVPKSPSVSPSPWLRLTVSAVDSLNLSWNRLPRSAGSYSVPVRFALNLSGGLCSIAPVKSRLAAQAALLSVLFLWCQSTLYQLIPWGLETRRWKYCGKWVRISECPHSCVELYKWCFLSALKVAEVNGIYLKKCLDNQIFVLKPNIWEWSVIHTEGELTLTTYGAVIFNTHVDITAVGQPEGLELRRATEPFGEQSR